MTSDELQFKMNASGILVFCKNIHTGTIVRVVDGWEYFPLGSPFGTGVHYELEECKEALKDCGT